jgi:hypothetical protein
MFLEAKHRKEKKLPTEQILGINSAYDRPHCNILLSNIYTKYISNLERTSLHASLLCAFL